MKQEIDIRIEADEVETENNENLEIITKPFSPSDIRLSTPPMNLGDIIDRINYRFIDFNTEYQRENNLWSDVQQSRLIESVLLGLRLPAFYFEEVSKKEWRIIDGLQRCCAIKNFCVDKNLKLEGLEFLSQYHGKGFDELPFDIQRDMRMLPVTVNLLEKGTPDDVKYILFKRLNTGGITLSPQEIRNAIFIGKAIDIVQEMSEYKEFLDATLNKIPTRRKQSMDFISRFIAFYLLGYESYSVSDLDNFINEAMKGIKGGLFDHRIESMKKDFIKSMLLASEIFGNDAFRKRVSKNDSRKPLNKAYFEVIAVAFANLDEDSISKLKDNKQILEDNLIKEMHDNASYASAFSGGTALVGSVKKRFSVFNEILRDSINGKIR